MLRTKTLTIDEWRTQRQKGIGGSDAAAAIGLNRWKSPLRLFLEKIGEADSNIDNEGLYWGTVLEDIVASEFEKRSEKKVHRVNQILVSDEHPFMIANIDRKVDGEDALLECKTTSVYNEDEWKDDQVPVEYLIQVTHYLAVTGYRKAYIAVLIGGNKFIYKEIQRDQELISMLIEKEAAFWHHVETRTPPAIDGSADSTLILDHLYPHANNVTLNMPVLEPLVDDLVNLKKQIKELEAVADEKENQIKESMKDAEKLIAGRYSVSWKNVISKRLDTTALKTNEPAVYERYLKENASRRFEIREG